jgi:hypothetical protein
MSGKKICAERSFDCVESFGDLFGDRKNFVEWNRSPRDAMSKSLTVDEFQHQCLHAV